MINCYSVHFIKLIVMTFHLFIICCFSFWISHQRQLQKWNRCRERWSNVCNWCKSCSFSGLLCKNVQSHSWEGLVVIYFFPSMLEHEVVVSEASGTPRFSNFNLCSVAFFSCTTCRLASLLPSALAPLGPAHLAVLPRFLTASPPPELLEWLYHLSLSHFLLLFLSSISFLCDFFRLSMIAVLSIWLNSSFSFIFQLLSSFVFVVYITHLSWPFLFRIPSFCLAFNVI